MAGASAPAARMGHMPSPTMASVLATNLSAIGIGRFQLEDVRLPDMCGLLQSANLEAVHWVLYRALLPHGEVRAGWVYHRLREACAEHIAVDPAALELFDQRARSPSNPPQPLPSPLPPNPTHSRRGRRHRLKATAEGIAQHIPSRSAGALAAAVFEIDRHQHPSSCQASTYVLGPLQLDDTFSLASRQVGMGVGLGSRHLWYRRCLQIAMDLGAVWIPLVPGHDSSQRLLRSWAGCTLADIRPRLLNRSSRVVSCHTRSQRRDGRYPWQPPWRFERHGVLWWKVVAEAFLLRPSEALAAAIRNKRHALWGTGSPTIAGIHIRSTDKAVEVPCFALEEYMAPVLAKNIRSVFLATDNPRLVDQARRDFGDRMPNIFSLNSSSRQYRHWSEEKAAVLLEESPAFERALVELFLLAGADLFVGTYSSNFGGLALLLALARRQFCIDALLLDNVYHGGTHALFLQATNVPKNESGGALGNGPCEALACSWCVDEVPRGGPLPEASRASPTDRRYYGSLELVATGMAQFAARPLRTSIAMLCEHMRDHDTLHLNSTASFRAGELMLSKAIKVGTLGQRLRILNYVLSPRWRPCDTMSIARSQYVTASPASTDLAGKRQASTRMWLEEIGWIGEAAGNRSGRQQSIPFHRWLRHVQVHETNSQQRTR